MIKGSKAADFNLSVYLQENFMEDKNFSYYKLFIEWDRWGKIFIWIETLHK